MNKIKINLENCYGIKELNTEFNFSVDKAQLIYAGNGVMKSSFAKVFSSLISGIEPKDNFFPKRKTTWSVTDSENNKIDPSTIFVIEPPQKKYECKRVSSLLVNQELKDEYDQINQNYSEAKDNILSNLKKFSKFKGNIDLEVSQLFGLGEYESYNLYEKFHQILIESNDPGYSGISYIEIFNPQVIKFLETSNFKAQIQEYSSKFNELISTSTYFKPEFNHLNASEISTSLKNNKFFNVNNQILLDKNGEKHLVSSALELETLFNEEKQKILTNPELLDRFSNIDDALNKNAELKKFRQFINENKAIIPELVNLEVFKKKLWLSYAYQDIESLIKLIDFGKSCSKRVSEIIQVAREQNTKWRSVVDEFNRRFSLPYTLDISNQHKVLLNEEAPSIVFTYIDGVESETVKEETLEDNLSTGERKAWYLLNIIFEIEARKSDAKTCLLIIDDIADSFDYKNKFAIIEYIKEIVETQKFHTIILSHNFDFFRTVRSRLEVGRNACFMPIRTKTGIKIEQAGYIENPLLHWKKTLHKDTKSFISMIAMVRNLIEYSADTECDAYKLLTSLLHIKENSFTITANGVIDCYNVIFKTFKPFDTDFLMLERIFETADEILTDEGTDIKLENKIILSIASRLKSEIFIKNHINDGQAIFPPKNQARVLLNLYKMQFPEKTEPIKILDKIALMTPENIHLNSFMYEPLMDLSDHHLKELYSATINLQH